MRRLKAPLSLLCASLLVIGPVSAQNAVRVEPPKGGLGWLTRSYQQREIPDINLNNSDRLASLIRAGNLYLSARDVIALALENNLDIEIQRYGPLMTRQVTKRAEGGGQLRGVGVPVSPGPESVSLTGVSVATTGATAAAAGASGILTQLGVPPVNLDPQVVFSANFAHSTSPSSNTVLTGTTSLITDNRSYQAQISKNWVSGTMAQFTFSSSRSKLNSARFNLNPFTSGSLDLTVTQNLLSGFGSAVNGRNIRVSKNNEKVSDLQFKQQVINTVSAVLNLYWDLVSFYQDVKARKDQLATAQQLYNDNKRQVQIGTLAPIEVTRAEAQVYSSQQDLLIAQTNLSQQETVLKNALSRNGVASPLLENVHVIPLDTIQVPKSDNLKPIGELVQEALKNRVEIQQSNLNVDSQKKLLAGVKSALRPSLQVFAEVTNNALSGSSNFLVPNRITADPFLIGGYGNFLGQIFRRNFPTYAAGLSLNIPLRNRAAQSDYVTSTLQLRQTELQLQKAKNQVRVDVRNAVIGLQQARVRYDSAVKARILQQQTLDADRKKYTLGASTVFQVVTDQQNLAAAESAEVQALANYSHARIAFDQALGTTLDVNHITFEEALSGQVPWKSVLPEKLPNPEAR